MKYQDNQTVIIKDNDGKLVEVFLLYKTDLNLEEVTWWFKFKDNANVSLITETELDEYNKDPGPTLCVCGSVATNQPGHDWYCNLK